LAVGGGADEGAAATASDQAARRSGIAVPVLCHAQHQTPVAVGRVCAVDVEDARVLAAACVRPVENGMEVLTASERVQQVRRTLYEVLLAAHPAPCRRPQGTGD